MELIGGKHGSEFARTVDPVPESFRHASYKRLEDLPFDAGRWVDLQIDVIGLSGTGTEALVALEFAGGGHRLADVAASTYHIPRVLSAEQQAKNNAAVALLTEWLEQKDDPAELRDWEEFKESVNQTRSSPRKLFP